MGLLLSILLSYVGGIELVFVIRDITHQVCLHQQRLKNDPSRDDENDAELLNLQNELRQAIAEASEPYNAEQMQDGIIYENGYRVADKSVNEAEDRWNKRRKELNSSYEDIPNESHSQKPTRHQQTNQNVPSETPIKDERTNNENASKIKTQFGQRAGKTYLEPKASEESSSYEPLSQQSSMSMDMPEIHFDEYDRADPNAPQYSEEYMRSLDGAKFRPIVRDDGSGRRRAFKKRQQSSSSTSSGEANLRSSREDELKMFTSLEEEEFEAMRNSDYTPIQYSSEANLKVKKHSRRHKKSPMKDGGGVSDEGDAENSDPWGDVPPKHFHDMEVWKRERNTSIVEETEDDPRDDTYKSSATKRGDKTARSPQMKSLITADKPERCYSPVGEKSPKLSSFEDATDDQHDIVLNALKKQTSKEDVPTTTTTMDNKNNRKGKNVSNDAALLPDANVVNPALADDSSLNACAKLDISNNENLFEEVKINEFISYIENLDGDDGGENSATDKFQFKEYLDLPHRVRHTSYNIDDKELDDIVLNIEEHHLVERVASQEEQLKNIQAEIKRINNSLAPVTRELLSPINLNISNTTTTSTVSSSVFINHETKTEEITRIYVQQQENVQNNESSPVSENFQKTANTDASTQSDVNKFITTERISLMNDNDEMQVNNSIQDNASKYIATDNISILSPTTVTVDFNLTPKVNGTASALAGALQTREESLSSNDSTKDYRRSQSSASGVSTRNEDEEELEYIKGREDWQEANRININEEIESDSYHHYRRHSETEETLEYIKGRDDWALNQASKMKSRTLPQIIELDDDISITIRDQIDSDEYHHKRRLSECLDLAYGVRFIAQGSARNGRSRSPYKVLRADIGKNEFLNRYYWGGAQDFERSASENRDVSEENMIQSERLIWLNTSALNRSRSKSPITIRIMVDNTANVAEEEHAIIIQSASSEEQLDSGDGSEDDRQTVVEINQDSIWDLDQSYDDETSPDIIEEMPDVDIIEVVLWDPRDDEHQSIRAIDANVDSDNQITEIYNSDGGNTVTSPEIEKSFNEIYKNISPTSDTSDTDLTKENDNDDESNTSKSTLRKSKTTRNLLETERLNSDPIATPSSTVAGSNEITEKTKKFIHAERESLICTNLNNPSSSHHKFANIDQQYLSAPATPAVRNTTAAANRNAKRSYSCENVDDLVQETSMGPWFHN